MPVFRLCRDHRRTREATSSALPTTAHRFGGPTAPSSDKWPNFQMSRIAKPADIYPVFRQLFAKQPASQKANDERRCQSHADKIPLAVFEAPTGISKSCRAPTTPSRRSRSTILVSTSIPNQMEIISSEQMLDAYSSIGMPLMYRHWSFGKHFLYQEQLYRKGRRGLAYELVINSNPCIVYLMEENTMALQALVTAHAAFGHNHFFKNNYLFRQWTDAGAILELYGLRQGLHHALRGAARPGGGGSDPRRRPRADGAGRLQVSPSAAPVVRKGAREACANGWNMRSAPSMICGGRSPRRRARRPVRRRGPARAERKKSLNLPEENLLYFLEKNSLMLEPWQREILRIVRVIAQYFYPQRQTQGDERGLRHLRALLHHEHALRPGPDQRRRHAGNPAATTPT